MTQKRNISAIIAIALFISPVLQAQQEPTGGGLFDSYSLPSFQSILEKTQDTVNWMKETVKEHPRKSFVLGVGALALFGAAYFLMHQQKQKPKIGVNEISDISDKIADSIINKYIEKTQHVIKPTYPVIISINKWIVLKNNKKIRVNANAKVQKLNTKLTISLDNKKIINNMEIKVDIGSAARSKDIKDAINLALQQALLQ